MERDYLKDVSPSTASPNRKPINIRKLQNMPTRYFSSPSPTESENSYSDNNDDFVKKKRGEVEIYALLPEANPIAVKKEKSDDMKWVYPFRHEQPPDCSGKVVEGELLQPKLQKFAYFQNYQYFQRNYKQFRQVLEQDSLVVYQKFQNEIKFDSEEDLCTFKYFF